MGQSNSDRGRSLWISHRRPSKWLGNFWVRLYTLNKGAAEAFLNTDAYNFCLKHKRIYNWDSSLKFFSFLPIRKLLVNTYYLEIFDMVSDGNLCWGYPLINGVCRWRHECGHMTFLGITFWCATFFLKL